MKKLLFAGMLLTAAFAAATAWTAEPSSPESDWNGYRCRDFSFEGRSAKIVLPLQAAEGKPWIWRARFFGHEPQADLALLALGYHVVYVDSAPLMGSPKSVELWQKFYIYLTENFGLSPKANLEGMSRGGLYVMNWALAYPHEVASIYIDNPVLDFKSWPGGFGHGARSDGDWQSVLDSYGLTEEEALAYKLNPIDQPALKALADAKVPILAVCGDSDKCVPFEENAKILKERYEKLGGPFQLILKPGCDHHPHSLPDPKPIVDFVTGAYRGQE